MPQAIWIALRAAAVAGLVASLSACSTPPRQSAGPAKDSRHEVALLEPAAGAESEGQARNAQRRKAGRPAIVGPRSRLQCVPYAREHSKIEIRGDAWTWWNAAKGKYRRGKRPAVGAVLVLKRNGKSRGHLAVVTEVISDREVIANHANWLNKGQIHLNTPIRDVSRDNDWSAVKVWYTPANVLGRTAYAAHGFIYPVVETAEN